MENVININYATEMLDYFFWFIEEVNLTPNLKEIDQFYVNDNDDLKLLTELYVFYNYEPNKKTKVVRKEVKKMLKLLPSKRIEFIKRKFIK